MASKLGHDSQSLNGLGSSMKAEAVIIDNHTSNYMPPARMATTTTSTTSESAQSPSDFSDNQQPAQQPTPSSSTAGFFQPSPQIPNLYQDDTAIQRALSLFTAPAVLNQATPSLTSLATRVLSPKILRHMASAEHDPPHVQHFDTFGRRVDNLITSEGWRGLQEFGIAEGMVSLPYQNTQAEYSRVLWAARYVLWCGSACWVNCPSLMVDGVAALLRRHLTSGVDAERMTGGQKEVLRSAYERLISDDVEKAWTTGQWMTERQGGSDVSMTETVATWDPQGAEVFKRYGVMASDGHELGPWRLDGFKWFSSATDANMVVMLARTEKGVSLFFAPMRRTLSKSAAAQTADGRETELNGVKIQRLKNKVGTRALPTAELELSDMRGWLIGEDGRGTKEIATVLNIARVHNGLTAIGLWGRGLAIVRAFVKVRVVGRRPLWERTAYMRTLARMHVDYRGDVLFNFFVAGLLGCVEQAQIAAFQNQPSEAQATQTGQLPGIKDATQAEWLLRLLTPALRGHCSKAAISGLQECMESLGGVGYLENDDPQFNIARLWRDSAVLPIWEGTTDMMADDSVIRVLFGKTRQPALAALTSWVTGQLERCAAFEKQANCVWEWWLDFSKLIDMGGKEELEMQARAVMERLVEIVQGVLLMLDVLRDEDQGAMEVMRAWFEERSRGTGIAPVVLKSETGRERDLKIVFGEDGPLGGRAKL